MPRTLRFAFVALVLCPPWQTTLAQAQSFFERPGASFPAPRLYGYRRVDPHRSPYAWPTRRATDPYSTESGGEAASEGPAPSYRTLCVRLCDGFYFPISFATNGSGLSRDADRCSASCGSEARLFYHANPGGDVDGMTDLTGLAYGTLPNAFKYRRMLVEGCRCRPQPWSEAEQERHRGYAVGAPVPGAAKSGISVRAGLAPSEDALARPASTEREAPEKAQTSGAVLPGNRSGRH